MRKFFALLAMMALAGCGGGGGGTGTAPGEPESSGRADECSAKLCRNTSNERCEDKARFGIESMSNWKGPYWLRSFSGRLSSWYPRPTNRRLWLCIPNELCRVI